MKETFYLNLFTIKIITLQKIILLSYILIKLLKNLHIQISTLDNENKFDNNFSKDNNDYLIENKTTLSSYNNFFNISSGEKKLL